MQWTQQKIVIIGGSSGIGLETAKAACALGAKVVIAGRSREKLEQAKQQIAAAQTFELDVTQVYQVQSFFERIGAFDHLLVTGSSTPKGTSQSLTLEQAKQGVETKFWGQYQAVKYAVSNLNQKGSIVLTSGILSQRPNVDSALMTAVNSAIEGLVRALCIELAPTRINAISPGLIDTPRLAQMQEDERQAISQKIPLKRLGSSTEAAQTALFLFSNQYITGVTIPLDGGYRYQPS